MIYYVCITEVLVVIVQTTNFMNKVLENLLTFSGSLLLLLVELKSNKNMWVIKLISKTGNSQEIYSL